MNKCILAFCALLLQSGLSLAVTPENGFWVNKAEPGYGFSIETQDRFVFLTAYTFADAGDPRLPTWIAAQGLMDGDAAFATGETLAIEFLSERSANLTWAGRTIPIERFDYYLTRNDPDTPPGYDMLLGQWQLVVDQTGVDETQPYFADVITLDRKGAMGGQGLGYQALGCRPGDSAGRCDAATNLANARAVVLQDDSGVVRITVAVDGDTTEYMLYRVRFSLNAFRGTAKRCIAADIPMGWSAMTRTSLRPCRYAAGAAPTVRMS
jgi:hypothetical protein